MIITLELRQESPDQPEICRMLAHSDSYYAALYPEDSNHLADVERLAQPDVAFYVARLCHVAIGFGALFDFGDYGEIKRMYVDKPQRGQGYGLQILETLENHAREHGITTLRLETGIRQPEAIQLYENHGYKPTSRYGDYPDDPLSVFMEKHLE